MGARAPVPAADFVHVQATAESCLITPLNASRPLLQPKLLKSPTGIAGLDEITGGGLPTGRPDAGRRRAGVGQDAARRHVPGERRHAVRRAGRPDEFRGERRRTGRRRGVAGVRSEGPRRAGQARWSITCTSSAARSRRRANTTSRACSCASIMRCGRLAPSASCSTRSSRCSADCRTKRSCGPSCGVCCAGCATATSRSLITGERGDMTLTRHGLEEYVTDAVILLDHRVEEQVSTRRIRVVKYRGSHHGTNEYPFLIDKRRPQRAAAHVAAAEASGVDRARDERPRQARRDARRPGLLPRQLGA